jgi:hypothetical protein
MSWLFLIGRLVVLVPFTVCTVLGFALLVDTGFTGASEWAPWAAKEAGDWGRAMATYAIITVIGALGTYKLIGGWSDEEDLDSPTS